MSSNRCGRKTCLGLCSLRHMRTYACVMAFPKTPASTGWGCLMERFSAHLHASLFALCLPRCFTIDLVEVKAPRTDVCSEIYFVARWYSWRAHMRLRGVSRVRKGFVIKIPRLNPVSPVPVTVFCELCVRVSSHSMIISRYLCRLETVFLHAHTICWV
jgi:hypothetical protein